MRSGSTLNMNNVLEEVRKVEAHWLPRSSEVRLVRPVCWKMSTSSLKAVQKCLWLKFGGLESGRNSNQSGSGGLANLAT